jgi:hypothetical protein
MRQLGWTLAALVSLGGLAFADSGRAPAADMASGAIAVEKSHRGVAQDYLVLPSGGELTAQMRFFTADAMVYPEGQSESGPLLLGGDKLKFTDLALFGISGRWSLFTRLELAASVELLPKQPATTYEKPWQSVGFALRSPLGRHVALALAGGGGHLMNHTGMWMREAITIEWKKPIHEVIAFDVEAGVNGLGLSDKETTTSTAYLTEAALRTTVLFHEPKGHWGAWIGIGYAVPIQYSGHDPTTEVAIDPEPRLSFHLGTVLSPVKKWDIYFDFAIIDRGDRLTPATQLPILDGGFDQKQLIFGITRHIESTKRTHEGSDEDGDDAVRLGSL